MQLADARSRLRTDLSDTAEEQLTDDDLDRAVQRAVSDLSRFLPLDAVLEVPLIFNVEDEAWTSAASAGAYVALEHKPIKFNSEVVKNAAGMVCTRNTDYYINYTMGQIAHISGGSIGNEESCTISYAKSYTTVDLSSISAALIRVNRVEYPMGRVPQSFVTYDVWGNLLTVTGDGGSQAELSAGEHILIYYKSNHTPPTIGTDGTYPVFLDDTVCLAASAYALLTLVSRYNVQGINDLTSAKAIVESISHTALETALDNAANSLVTAMSALDKVNDYLAGVSTPSAKKFLTDGDSKLAAVDLTAAKSYLSTGDDFINKANIMGASVAENYGEYGRISAQIEAALAAQAEQYSTYAGRSTDIAIGFIQEAAQRNRVADSYIDEASGRDIDIQRHLDRAEKYIESAEQCARIAERFRAEAIDRRNEAWAIWKDPSQYLGDWVMTPVRQPAAGR